MAYCSCRLRIKSIQDDPERKGRKIVTLQGPILVPKSYVEKSISKKQDSMRSPYIPERFKKSSIVEPISHIPINKSNRKSVTAEKAKDDNNNSSSSSASIDRRYSKPESTDGSIPDSIKNSSLTKTNMVPMVNATNETVTEIPKRQSILKNDTDSPISNSFLSQESIIDSHRDLSMENSRKLSEYEGDNYPEITHNDSRKQSKSESTENIFDHKRYDPTMTGSILTKRLNELSSQPRPSQMNPRPSETRDSYKKRISEGPLSIEISNIMNIMGRDTNWSHEDHHVTKEPNPEKPDKRYTSFMYKHLKFSETPENINNSVTESETIIHVEPLETRNIKSVIKKRYEQDSIEDTPTDETETREKSREESIPDLPSIKASLNQEHLIAVNLKEMNEYRMNQNLSRPPSKQDISTYVSTGIEHEKTSLLSVKKEVPSLDKETNVPDPSETKVRKTCAQKIKSCFKNMFKSNNNKID